MQKLEPFEMVLFGGTGDLAMRKLMPALFRRFIAGQFDAKARILGVASSTLSREQYLARVEEHCRRYLDSAEFSAEQWTDFAACLDYQIVDATRSTDFEQLRGKLSADPDRVRVWYLSTSPSLYGAISAGMAATGVVTPGSRVVMEKPLGHDQRSAEAINRQIGALFAESQIYRIDHYLGKETVQNLLALRFGNTLFEPLWKRGRIRHVQITVAEELGVEGRASFYDEIGALRDMVQSHLLQLVCILAMEPPSSAAADAVRDEKLKVLRALRPIDAGNVALKTVRGQYRAGTVAGEHVVGYADEPGVAPGSTTETFVALKAEIDTWRWAGVPFYLRTGKRLQQRVSEIAITFEDVPHAIFDTRTGNAPNQLVIQLQPDESITLTIMAKTPGDTMRLRPVDLALDLGGSFKERRLDAYERLLMDVVKGNLTLFMRRDELDAAWRWIDPIRAGWDQIDDPPKHYTAGSSGPGGAPPPTHSPAGSAGPAAASALIGRDGFAWRDDA